MSFVAAGFERVAEEFERNFSERGDHGAAFAAFVEGEPVVDLWGGVADERTGEPWREDTMQVVFSGTKGFVAVCLLLLLERDELELDEPVARYWPEFSDARVVVRDAVSHTAALPGLRTPLTLDDLPDYERMAQLLADAEPFWEPGTRIAYHPLTYGWLCGELVRRASGRSVGRFFTEEVASSLELELWLGLPEELEPRVARLRRHADYRSSAGDATGPLQDLVYANPPFLTGEEFPWNERRFHASEIPAVNAIGTARSIARLYGELPKFLGDETLRLGTTRLAEGRCAVTDWPYAFGVGFELQTEMRPFGPADDGFGHTGAGGSVHGAWPSLRTAFSYSMNELRAAEGDERARSLLAALHEAVRG